MNIAFMASIHMRNMAIPQPRGTQPAFGIGGKSRAGDAADWGGKIGSSNLTLFPQSHTYSRPSGPPQSSTDRRILTLPTSAADITLAAYSYLTGMAVDTFC